ncbi:hypothetical protein [Bacillus sp. FJAT-42376]|nr:hypothetical protein [Bacillus sp. FJAT-42376]
MGKFIRKVMKWAPIIYPIAKKMMNSRKRSTR